MNYIEELLPGNAFIYQNEIYVTTTDFKTNRHRLCVSLIDGKSRWISPSEIIQLTTVYTIDSDNNIVSIKKDNSNEKNIKIS